MKTDLRNRPHIRLSQSVRHAPSTRHAQSPRRRPGCRNSRSIRGARLVRTALLLGAALWGLSACQHETPRVQTVIDGFAQGGTYHIVIVADTSYEHLKPAIDSLLETVEMSVSLYNPDSRLSRLNRGETDTLDDFLAECIREAEQVSRESEGRYDITIKPLIAAYGFAEQGATQHPNVDSLMQMVGYEKISVENGRLRKAHPGIQLDLNSIAQGATADRLGELLDAQGLTDYLIEIGGGEIVCKGHNAKGMPWRVGIDRPVDGNIVPGADLQVRLAVSGVGLATSGNYRKFYTDSSGRKIVHTVDALSGEPVVSNLLSATVIAPTSTRADAYGTLCMILGLERSIEMLGRHPDMQAYLVWSDERGNLRTHMTPGMEKRILPQP